MQKSDLLKSHDELRAVLRLAGVELKKRSIGPQRQYPASAHAPHTARSQDRGEGRDQQGQHRQRRLTEVSG